jgi:hypothetical protein
MHKNLYLKNKWLFVNDFRETQGKNSEGDPEKIMIIIEGTDVLDYKNFLCIIKFNAQLKFNKSLRMKNIIVNISEIEIKDTVNNVNINLLEFKRTFMSLYSAFKSFMSELKGLIQDLNFLNNYL